MAALFERARVVVKRNQGEEALRQMFLHAHVRAQQTVETLHRARRADGLLQYGADLLCYFAKILEAAAPIRIFGGRYCRVALIAELANFKRRAGTQKVLADRSSCD